MSNNQIQQVMLAAAALLLLGGCAGPAPATGPNCLYGPEAGTAACEALDDEPERCRIEGGIYDVATQRCIR
ncbi:MAG: hypothetical protein ACFCVH_17880 [Alphaproteobacteria bacterium]